MNFNTEAKVGLFTLIGICVLIGIVIYYGNYKYGEDQGYTFTIVFERVDGLKRGADVQVAGVRVGQVANVNFTKDQLVDVVVKINSLSIDIDRDSVFLIDAGIVGEKWLSVRPKSNTPKQFISKDGNDRLKGDTPVNLQDLTNDVKKGIAKVTDTVETINQTAKNVNIIVGDKETQAALKDSVLNVRKASAELNRLLVKAGGHLDSISSELQSALAMVSSELEMTTADIRSNLDRVSGDVYRFTNTLNRIAGDNEGDIRGIVKNLNETSKELMAAIDSVNNLVGDEELTSDIRETIKSLRRTTATVEETATNLQAFITDEELQQDLKETIANARSTLENADALLSDTREFFAKRDTLIPSKVAYELDIYGTKRKDNSDVSGSVDVLAYLYNKKQDTFLQVGLTDVNGDNRVNAQLGKILDANNTFRFGIIKAKFGFGYDYNITDRTSVNFDVFDINDITLDFRGRYKINDRVELILGIDDVFKNTEEIKLGTGLNF